MKIEELEGGKVMITLSYKQAEMLSSYLLDARANPNVTPRIFNFIVNLYRKLDVYLNT